MTSVMTQLAQGFRFNLPDALARDCESLAELFERVLAAIVQAESHLDNCFLARGQRFQYLSGLLTEVQIEGGLRRRNPRRVDNEIGQVRFVFRADWHVERNRLVCDAL